VTSYTCIPAFFKVGPVPFQRRCMRFGKNIYLRVSNTLRNKFQTANKIPCRTECSDLHYVNIGSKVQNIVFCFISHTLRCFDATITKMFEFILIAFIRAPAKSLYFYFIRNFNFWKNLGIPYVKPLRFFGSLKD
jgi:hypothetical protein